MKKILFAMFLQLCMFAGLWAQQPATNMPAGVNVADATITSRGHATMKVKQTIQVNPQTQRADTLRTVEEIDWNTQPGTARSRMAARARRNTSATDFYDEETDWWLDLYWYTYNYPSVNANGEPVILSSMACMPDGDADRVNNVIIGCHVTITDNKSCPTMYNHGGSSLTDVSMLMNQASSGYVWQTEAHLDLFNLVILPDYEGYGTTVDVAHPYLYQEVTARQVVDATRYGIALYRNSPAISDIRHPFRDGWRTIALGYSQGGSVAMATHRFIEQNGLTDELNFAGSVCGDGPYDPISTILYYVNQDLAGNSMDMAVVLPLILKGMCDSNPYMQSHKVNQYLEQDFLETGILTWLTEKILNTDEIKAEWAKQWSQGEHRGVLQEGGTARLVSILQHAGYTYFKNLYLTNSDFTKKAGVPVPAQRGLMEDLHLALESNNLTGGWNPTHPMHLYHSSADHVVPVENRNRVENVFGSELVKKYEAGFVVQWDHVGSGKQFYLGSARVDALEELAESDVHPAISAKPHANQYTGYVWVNGAPYDAEYVLGDDGKLTLGSGYTACMSQYVEGVVEVPATIRINGIDYPVTAINDFAFRLCNKITGVKLNDGMTRIGRFAFVGCNSLQDVNLPSTLTTIGSGAFIRLPNLKAVTSLATTPPTWEYNDVFCFHDDGIGDTKDYSTSSVTLYVPNGYGDEYTAAAYSDATIGWTKADGWGTWFTNIRELAQTDAQPYAVYDDGTLTFCYDNRRSTYATTYDLPTTAVFGGWNESADIHNSITKVVITPMFIYHRPVSTQYWFANLPQLTSIEGMEYLNTSATTTMANMFWNSKKLTTVDLSHLNTSNVTDFTSMFQECEALESVDLSSFDTGNATKLSNMFQLCKALTTINISGFDTRKVKEFDFMFYGCSHLTSLNMTNFDFTAAVRYPESFISECTRLETFYIPTTMTDASSAFDGCTSLSDVYYYGLNPFTVWDDNKTVFKGGKTTKFHVLPGTLAAWQTAWPSANCTFVGDMATEQMPLDIYTADDWAKLKAMVEAGHTDIYATLQADLNVNTIIGNAGGGTFSGTFDGNGHTITANIEGSKGLFYTVKNGTIKNLHDRVVKFRVLLSQQSDHLGENYNLQK